MASLLKSGKCLLAGVEPLSITWQDMAEGAWQTLVERLSEGQPCVMPRPLGDSTLAPLRHPPSKFFALALRCSHTQPSRAVSYSGL